MTNLDKMVIRELPKNDRNDDKVAITRNSIIITLRKLLNIV